MMCKIAVIASKKDVAPVFRCKWSSGFAAVYVLAAMPGAGIPAIAGQSELKPAPLRDNLKTAHTAKPTPAKSVVVVTGKLDLGKITIADFGDVEPTPR
jgi:hypothetical protein